MKPFAGLRILMDGSFTTNTWYLDHDELDRSSARQNVRLFEGVLRYRSEFTVRIPVWLI